MGPGGSARPDPRSKSGRCGPPPAPPPPPAGLGAIARSEVRWLPPAGYYPLAAGRVLRSLPPPPGGWRGVVICPPEGGRGASGGGAVRDANNPRVWWQSCDYTNILSPAESRSTHRRSCSYDVGLRRPPCADGRWRQLGALRESQAIARRTWLEPDWSAERAAVGSCGCYRDARGA